MAVQVGIQFEAELRNRQAFQQIQQSLQMIENETRDLLGVSRMAAGAVDNLGDEAQQSAAQMRQMAESARRTGAETMGLTRGFGGATGGAGKFSGALGSVGAILGGLGVAAVGSELLQFGTSAVRAAAELEGFERGLRLIEGTNAPQRLEELIEVANLPGLNLTDLINYSNRLRAIGLSADETDRLLQSTGQTIVAFGGTADTAREAVEQITQAFSNNQVSLQDFRSIAQRVPGFYQAIADVHDVEANIDGFRMAVDSAGSSVKDALLPVMDELANRFGQTPSDSYVVAIDSLQNSFFLLRAEIGSRFLPIVVDAAQVLSTFFDAIRENDLDALPEPIQNIVMGAQSLFETFRNLAESFRDRLGPEINDLLPALGNLLGEIFELIAAIGPVLSPLLGYWATGMRVIISLVVKLADDLGSVIGAVTDFVNWVRGASEEQDKLVESTKNTSAALMQGASATQQFQSNLETLQSSVANTSARLNEKQRALQNLVESGYNMAHPAVQQLNRQISALESQLPMATQEVDNLKQGFLGVEMPANTAKTATRGFISSIGDFSGALDRVDTRFLTFHERTEALSVAIRELPPEIAAVRTEFDALAPTTARVDAIFTEYNETLGRNVAVSGIVVSSAEEEAKALAAVTEQIIQQTQDAEALAHIQEVLTQRTDAHNAALVNPAVSDAVESLRDFSNIIGDVNLGYDEIIPLTQDFVDGLVAQESAFDDLREATGAADLSLDDFDETMQAIDQAAIDATDSVSSLDLAFEELGNNIPGFLTDTLDLLALMNSELEGVADSVSNLVRSAASGDAIGFLSEIPGIAQSLNELQTDPNLTTEARAGRVFDVIDQILASDLSVGQQQELIQPLQDYIREVLVQSILSAPEAISQALIAQQESFAGIRGVDFSFERDRAALGLGETPFQTAFDLPELDLSRIFERLEGIITRAETRSGISTSGRQRRDRIEDVPEETVTGRPGGTGRSTATQPTLRALTDVQSAYIQSLGFDPSIYGYDRRRNAFIKTAGGEGPTLIYDNSVEFDEARTPTAPTGSELGTPTATAPTPRRTFAFTQDDRGTLAPYETAVRIAEDAVEDLRDDSTPAEIAQAYQDLVFAQTNLRDVSRGLIEAAEMVGRITSTAATNAITDLNLDLGDDFRSANTTLIRSLSDVGFEVIGGIENIREAIDVSDVSSVFRRIPEMVETAVEAVEEAVEEAAPAPEPEVLRNVHRFTGDQRDILGGLQETIDLAQQAVDRLDEDSTQDEIVTAYTNLANAEQALFNQQLSFIENATGITEKAREQAGDLAEGRFQDEIADANEDLVGALEGVGLQLTTTITDWFAILMGAALAVEAIPPPVIPEPEVEPEVVTEPEVLRNVHRFTGDQRDILGGLQTTIDLAQQAVDRLNADSTQDEIVTAYTNLANAEQALFNQQLSFIENATGITEKARTDAEGLATGAFEDEIADANTDLVDALAGIGLQLTTTITDWFSILSGASLAIEAIPPPEVPEAPPEPAPEPEVLRNVHRFTGDQRDILGGLQTTIDLAQQAVDRLNADSTQDEIVTAYTNLANAEQALFNQQLSFIENATGITEKARTDAEGLATGAFEDEIADANTDLVDALAGIGLQLTTTITDWFSILTGAQLAIEQIPDPVELEEAVDIPEPEALRDRHRFTGAQNQRLGILRTNITAAEDAIGLLDETSTEQEIVDAYANLATAEQDLYDQQVSFINSATNITEAARMTAISRVEGTFGREIFDANVRLVAALEDIGRELVTMFDATTGILTGTALAVQQIQQQVATDIPETESIVEDTLLRSVFRFSDTQRTQLGILAGNIEKAEDAIRLLGEDSTPEQVTAAYTALGEAETAYYNQQLAFIDEGVGIFTDDALRTGRETAAQDLRGNLFDANMDLVDALEDIGFELVTMLTATSGLLTGTALAVRSIQQQIEESVPDVQFEPEVFEPINTSLLENAIQRAQFQLTGATSEAEFEQRRQNLINAVNSYYDLEEARIEQVAATELELRDLREDNQLARLQALRRAGNATNQFAEERIAEEERVQAELLRLEEARAREIDSVHAAIATEEANRLEALQDLQERHNDRLIELEESLQDRLFDIREDAADRLEDLNREQARSLEDLNTDFARRLFGGDVVSAEDLTARQRQQLETDPEYQRALFDLNRRGSRQREDFEVDFGTLTDPGARDALINEIRSGARAFDPEAEALLGRESSGELRGFLEELRDTQIDFLRTQEDIQLEGQIEAANLAGLLHELFTTPIVGPGLEREPEGFGFQDTDPEREQERAELQQETAQLERETIDYQRELVDMERENVVQATALIEQQHELVSLESELAALANANILSETGLLESQRGLAAFELETAQFISQTAQLESQTAHLTSQTSLLESQTAALQSQTAQFESVVVQRDLENTIYFRAVNDVFLQGSQHLLVAAATLLNAASLSQSAAIATQAAAETPATVNVNIDSTEIGDAVVQAQDEGTVLASPSVFTDA